MTGGEWATAIQLWLRPEHAPAYRAALDWLLPRCRTDEERLLAPALLLLLSPLNALIVPCRPIEGSRVNFQVTISREGADGPERVRVIVRAMSAGHAAGGQRRNDSEASPGVLPDVQLDSAGLLANPLEHAVLVLRTVLFPHSDSPPL